MVLTDRCPGHGHADPKVESATPLSREPRKQRSPGSGRTEQPCRGGGTGPTLGPAVVQHRPRHRRSGPRKHPVPDHPDRRGLPHDVRASGPRPQRGRWLGRGQPQAPGQFCLSLTPTHPRRARAAWAAQIDGRSPLSVGAPARPSGAVCALPRRAVRPPDAATSPHPGAISPRHESPLHATGP